MRRLTTVLALALVGRLAVAADAPPRPPAAAPTPPAAPPAAPPPSLAQAVDAALAAVRAADAAAVAALAGRDDPDPWLVADELLARGEADPAAAFAEAARRPDVEALPAYVARRRGKGVDAGSRAALAAALAALEARDDARALAALEGAVPTDDRIPWIRILYARGAAWRGTKALAQSAEALAAAGREAKAIGWLARADVAFHQAGVSAMDRSDAAGALAAWEERLAVTSSRGPRAALARALTNLAIAHMALGNYPRAIEVHERARQAYEAVGDRAGLALTLGNLGIVYASRGEYRRALATQERALALMEALGDAPGIARTVGNLGGIHTALADYPRALAFQERALRLAEQLGNQPGIATTLGNIGGLYDLLGDYPQALAYSERARRLHDSLGNRAGVAGALGNIGLLHKALGDLPRALEAEQAALEIVEAIGDRAGVARILGNLGLLHAALGDDERALALYERSLAASEAIGDRGGAARTLGNLGGLLGDRGDYEEAQARNERALELSEAIGDRVGTARTLGNLGVLHLHRGDLARALAYQERSLALKENLGDREGVAATLANLSAIHLTRGDLPRARDALAPALDQAVALGLSEIQVRALWGLSAVALAAGDPRAAAATARRAVDVVGRLATGLAEEQGARAREPYADVFGIGVRAAQASGDATDVAFFLESGRAATLLEALGGRDVVRAFTVPDDLRQEEAVARAAEVAAQKRQLVELDTGDLARIREAKGALDAAQTRVGEVIERIQQRAKAATSVVYPVVDALPTIAARLRADEALVLYGVFAEDAMALVVTATSARIVALAAPAAIAAACDAEDWARLGALVVEPLALGDGVRRLLVSPMGALAFAPFCVLAPTREVVYVPSGTTYGLLLPDADRRGEGVLALGDPDYGSGAAPSASARPGASHRLAPLPATREEAKAVGDVVLLGAAATESALLRGIEARSRWHAVHLACHGLVDPRKPARSALALSNGDFLTTLEVFRAKIPADLVVLSACETGRGKVYRAEGIVGFVRAFLYAGAPRVIVSLWKVDDEATRALMTKFYALWNPEGGAGGLGAAAALRAAQAHVRAQPRWSDPRFWAAWQLWGLAN